MSDTADGFSAETELVALLKEKKMLVSSAESLTGGLLAARITSVPGASEVFECGVSAYSNRIKSKVLGVKKETLTEYSEYSTECAKEMAQGVKMLSGADIGISTTGIAGPGGGTPEKPVGTVYVGIAVKNDSKAAEFHFDSKKCREEIRSLTVDRAIRMMLDALKEYSDQA